MLSGAPSEEGRLAEGILGSCSGHCLRLRGAGVPVKAELSQKLLNGHLSVKHFDLGRGFFQVGPFHGIELMARAGQCRPEHTAGRLIGVGPAYGSPKPACTSPPM